MITFDSVQLWVMFAHWIWLNMIFLGSGWLSQAVVARWYPEVYERWPVLGRANVTVSGYWCLGLVLLAQWSGS